MRKWVFQEDITYYFKEIVLRSRRSAYPRMTSLAHLKSKFPKEINDTENTLAELQPDFAFAMDDEQRAIERNKRMSRVFGGYYRHATFDEEEEFLYDEYRELLYGKYYFSEKLFFNVQKWKFILWF